MAISTMFFCFLALAILGIVLHAAIVVTQQFWLALLSMPAWIVGAGGAVITGAIWAFQAAVAYLQSQGAI